MRPSLRSHLLAGHAAPLVAIALLAIAGLASSRPDPLPPPLAREFRGAWVTPVAGGGVSDWPSHPGLSTEAQQAELLALLDHARDIGLNAIVLHVRMAGDALYPTTRAPWSTFLTGKSGVAPSPAYDPLAFAIEQAHARGLQLHAWFNPFRALIPSAPKVAALHVTKAHPSWVRTYGKQTWIDPGEPAARASVLASIFEVVEKYDIDGVHLDDYFYPYRERRTITKTVGKKRVRVAEDIPFPDNTTWKKYGEPAGFVTRADWRRANIDGFVHDLYVGVKSRKPWVTLGISPFGIWKSGTPEGVTGLDAYGEIYADSRKWLREGWVDYLAPQLYWAMDGDQHRFTALEAWWRTQNPLGRYVWPGLNSTHVGSTQAPWPQDEIVQQIERTRQLRADSEPAGHIHFRIGALLASGGALGERLRASEYATPALVPAMPWLSSAPPATPTPSVIGTTLTIDATDSIPVAWWLVQTLAASGGWSTRLRPSADRRIALSSLGDAGGGRIAVTAIDRAGVASAPALVVSEAGVWRLAERRMP